MTPTGESWLDGSSQVLVERLVSVANRTSRVSVEPLLGGLLRRRKLGKGKGCDIGYALAVSSCEETNSVDACTVTALDAITAFAVPNPNCSSQSQSVFSGLVALPVARLADH